MKNILKYLSHFIIQIIIIVLIWSKHFSDWGDMVMAINLFPLFAYPLSFTIGRWSDFKILNRRYYDKYLIRDISLNFIFGGLYLPIYFLLGNKSFLVYFIIVMIIKNIIAIRNVRTLIREDE